ncbi:hypothetical protein [Vibrio alginolyticus]|uniref:hypothetical protein n=1 Tax=Vibrio alginolyticus TaxID=663 RepID=UPI00215C7359|nr:hypothetical protein [Vibrio alginolyticus]MCR9586572.1 hypothetical protein [Vibrio alginolyticus]
MPFTKAIAENKNLQKKKEFAANSMLDKRIRNPQVVSLATSPIRIAKIEPFPLLCDRCSSDEQYLIQFWLTPNDDGVTDKILLCQSCADTEMNIACPKKVELIGDS